MYPRCSQARERRWSRCPIPQADSQRDRRERTLLDPNGRLSLLLRIKRLQVRILPSALIETASAAVQRLTCRLGPTAM